MPKAAASSARPRAHSRLCSSVLSFWRKADFTSPRSASKDSIAMTWSVAWCPLRLSVGDTLSSRGLPVLGLRPA
eukprot:11557646-Alexandrium_andersonii.AAC.1